MEAQTQFSPEDAGGPFSFKIGDEDFGFEGKFTERESKNEFVGMIRGGDGKEFSGAVVDLGGGRYRLEDFDGGRGIIESPAETGSAAMVESPVGFDDAVMAAAMDSAPVEAATRAEPQPEQVEAAPAEAVAELPLPVEPEPAAAEEPAAEAVQPPAPEPAPEPEIVPEPAVVELPAPAPEPVAEPAGAPEKSPEESRHPLIVDLQQKMQGVYRPFQAARLWKQAEAVRAEVNKTKSEKKISQFLAEEGRLKRQAEELHPGIEKMTETEREKLSLESVPLSAEGATEAVKISSPRHREDMAVFYDTELQKWESVLRNPADFEQYRTAAAEIETKKNEARKLFSGESDKKLLNRAIAQIDQTGSGQLKELEAKLPQRLLELAGFIQVVPLSTPTIEMLNKAESDVDLRLAYNRAAQQLYAELAGQPQTVAETVTAPMPEPEPAPTPTPAPEPILPPEPVVTEPVVEATAEVTPQAEPEPAPAEMEKNPAEVVLPTITAETEMAPEPIEAPLQGDHGQVVVDAAEQAMVSRMPVEAPVEAAPDSSSDAEVPEWLVSPVTAPMPEEPAAPAGAPVMAPTEMPAQREVKLTPDQIRERAERRRNNFASAVAQLEGAYMDTAGTKNERVGRVVEGVRKMMLAGLELAEEGGVAQEVVMNVLGRLNNEQNRPLVQAAAGQAPEQVERAVGEMLQARGAFGPDGKPKSRKELEDSGLVGLIELLLELGMSFTDASVNAVITEVQSATGAGR